MTVRLSSLRLGLGDHRRVVSTDDRLTGPQHRRPSGLLFMSTLSHAASDGLIRGIKPE